jgi:hypothetical protein
VSDAIGCLAAYRELPNAWPLGLPSPFPQMLNAL